MKCVRCGNSKKLFEKFTSYGFCQKCHQTLKADIESRVSKINRFLASVAQIPKDDLSQKVDYYLKEIASLEELRAKVPMFKSSLTAQLQKLIDLKSTLQPSGTSVNTDNQPLIIPEKIGQCELRYLYQDVWVVGTQYATPDFSQLQLRQQVTLVPDPANEHDPRAVKVMCGSLFLGYLSIKMDRIKSMVFDWHKKGAPIFAGITLIDLEKNHINLVIGFYLDSKEILSRCESFPAKLTKTSKNDWEGTSRQEHLFWLNPGDILDANYDYETQTFILTDDLCRECGELNKSLSEKLLVDDNLFPYVVVDDVTTDDNDKYSVSVTIYLKPLVRPR